METKTGFIYAVLAFLIWGLYPLYWNLLAHISPNQILVHRMVWAFLMVGAFVLLTKKGYDFWALLKKLTWKRGGLLLLTAALLSANWLIYTWAVNNGRILYASLGYYINPLVSILMGVIVLKEKLTRYQLIAMIVAGIGVLFLTFSLGALPWISLALAFSFATYGLCKKLLKMDPIFSLLLETALMLPMAFWYFSFGATVDRSVYSLSNVMEMALLVGGGFITILPLFFFNKAAQLIPLKYIGFIQYVAPTLAFLISVFIFNEPFTIAHLIAFSFIWTACLIFISSHLKVKKKALLTD